MQIQVKTFKARYNSGIKLEMLNEEDKLELSDIINRAIENMPLLKDMTIMEVLNKSSKSDILKLRTLKLGNGEVGQLLTEDDRIKWINCDCGGVGKFRKEEL